MNELTSTQAFWLGHLFHASSRQLALGEYAEAQRLRVQAIAVPPRHRPMRFVAVKVVP